MAQSMSQAFQWDFDNHDYGFDGRESRQCVPQRPPMMQSMMQGCGPQGMEPMMDGPMKHSMMQFVQLNGGNDGLAGNGGLAGTGAEFMYMPGLMMEQPMHTMVEPPMNTGMQQGPAPMMPPAGMMPQPPQPPQPPQMQQGALMRSREERGGDRKPPPLPSGISPPPEWARKTTVMMRNIPNKYMQRMLLSEIHEAGFLGTYDFLYLPIDPETNANKGYAFINFVEPSFAWMFRMSYEGRKMNTFNSAKVVSVTPAALQGFEANYAHYSNARVNRGDVSCRPLFLREPRGMPEMQELEPRGRRGLRQGARRLDKLVHMQAGEAGEALREMVAGKGGGKQGPGGPPKKQLVAQFCSQCGTKGQPSFLFCPNCGASMDLSRPVA